MLNIEETLIAFQNVKVLVVGDVMLDRYIYGKVNRISPEAPVPIINLERTQNRPGGAANVALNIQSLGAQVVLLSTIGADKNADILLDTLKDNQLNKFYIHQSNERKTTTKTRILAQNQQMLRMDEEDTTDLSVNESQILLKNLKNILNEQSIDVLLFQDYNKGVLSAPMIKAILSLAKKHQIPTLVDPKNKNFYAYKGVDLFKPNLKEINSNLPFQSMPTLKDLNKASAYLKTSINPVYTLITLAEKGIYFQNNEAAKILPTAPRNIADVCGAGDAVISIAALGLALNMSLENIAFLANLAGGQVCEKVGVAPATADKLKTDFYKYK